MATPERLEEWRRAGYGAAVLLLQPPAAEAVKEAARRVRQSGLELDYWVEVARSPELADRHPEWMASLQGHPEWRRYHPGAPQPAEGEVIKKYPWVPISYKEAQQAQIRRITALLKDLPAPRRLYLNGLQAGPSACGCGNLLCQWTADYGPITTASPLGDNAASLFLDSLAKQLPQVRMLPVWIPECEEADMPKGRACDGVACFSGACWPAWVKQLSPVEKKSPQIGVLALHRELQRSEERYGPPGAWSGAALRLFQSIPPARGGRAIPSGRLIAVVQQWGVAQDESRRALESAVSAGAGEIVAACTPISSAWEPRLYRAAKKSSSGIAPGKAARLSASRFAHCSPLHLPAAHGGGAVRTHPESRRGSSLGSR